MYEPKPEISDHAHVPSLEVYQRMYERSIEDPVAFWGEQAEALSWFHPWREVVDRDYDAVDFSWFSGGRLNATSLNCPQTARGGRTSTQSTQSTQGWTPLRHGTSPWHKSCSPCAMPC